MSFGKKICFIYSIHKKFNILIFLLQLVRMEHWLPETLTNAAGREFSRLTFISPFLRLSVFAEDDVSNKKAELIIVVISIFYWFKK